MDPTVISSPTGHRSGTKQAIGPELVSRRLRLVPVAVTRGLGGLVGVGGGGGEGSHGRVGKYSRGPVGLLRGDAQARLRPVCPMSHIATVARASTGGTC